MEAGSTPEPGQDWIAFVIYLHKFGSVLGAAFCFLETSHEGWLPLRGGTLDPPSPDACHSLQSCFKTSALRLASCTHLWRVLAHSWWTDRPWRGPLTHPTCRCQVAVPGVCSLTPPQFWRLPLLHNLSLQHLLLGTLIFALWWVRNSILLF